MKKSTIGIIVVIGIIILLGIILISNYNSIVSTSEEEIHLEALQVEEEVREVF